MPRQQRRRIRVLPYRAGSRGASALARALGGLCLKVDGTSRFVPRYGDVVINWGNTNPDLFPMCTHNGVDLRSATNKLNFFQTQSIRNGDIIPEFWTRREDIPEDAYPIVCRTVLAGHSGEGIVIANDASELVAAPLYVKYIKKQDEYRIHVGVRNREQSITTIISSQRKARRRDVEEPNWQVRNHANGFIYAREGVVPPECVVNAATRALLATNLDFGAVDVLYNARHDRAYVLEINTAAGLEGQTVEDYVSFFTGG